jgi:hypothetical protein
MWEANNELTVRHTFGTTAEQSDYCKMLIASIKTVEQHTVDLLFLLMSTNIFNFKSP